MERTIRWLFLGLAALLAYVFVPKILNGNKDTLQPIGPGKTETADYALSAALPEKCTIAGNGYQAVLSTRGAALVDYTLTGSSRYTEKGAPIELTTVPGSAPDRFALRFDWRALGTTGKETQVAHDVVDWKLVSHDATSCTFAYQDDSVELTKTFEAGKGPYELVTRATIENLGDEKRVHRLGVENTAWMLRRDTTGSLGRQSPHATEVACGHDGGELDRKSLSDFAPKDFEKPGFEDGFYVNNQHIDFAATSNAYFAQAIVPLAAPAAPACGLQIEERWYHDRYQEKAKDPDFGAMYRSRLIYPAKELAPHEKATYEVLAYYGPKDRTLLASAAGGQHSLSKLINLGTFAIISKVLVSFLVKVHGFVGNWGIAIIVLTICVRLVLFPLTWKQIQSTLQMRRLKPEVDAINKKFADDAQQKQVAMMEMYRKNGVNPFGGCLPVLVQMPVWWALYATLQSAVELYHTPFLWFKDLSGPDPYFVLPFIIGATSFVQTKMMPQQVDAAQQKMMLYFMPALFTFMMLFLPSGLGIYMLTNSILGIVQQQAIERFAPSRPSGGIGVRDTPPKDDDNQPGKKGQGRKLTGAVPAKLKG